MGITTLRDNLRQARAQAEAGDTSAVIRTLDEALREIEPERLVTVEEAAILLRIQVVDVIKYWCRSGFLRCVRHDGLVAVPLSEIERIQGSGQVQAIRIADAYHDASSELGTEEGLSDEELQMLSETRPGRLPWQE
jgi:hypothetical protein